MGQTEFRQMTRDELDAIAGLRAVRFPCASWDKRFARSIKGKTVISENQASQMWRLFIRYRRQINIQRKTELFAIAETLAAPDLRKQPTKVMAR